MKVLIFIVFILFYSAKGDKCWPPESQYSITWLNPSKELFLSTVYRSEPKNIAVVDVTTPTNWTNVIVRVWLDPSKDKMYIMDLETKVCTGSHYVSEQIKKVCIENIKFLGNAVVGGKWAIMITGTVNKSKIFVSTDIDTKRPVSWILTNGKFGDYGERTVYNYINYITPKSVLNIPKQCFNKKKGNISQNIMGILENWIPFS